jgi:predicted phosphodiesterase
MNKSEIAAQYRKRFPEAPIRSLANKMYEENKEAFVNWESARNSLRYIEGKKGNANRASAAKNFPESLRTEPRPINPFEDLPKSDKKERKPYVVSGKRILFLSDIHIPYHDEEALALALQYGKEKDADCIYLNGDILDFYHGSTFEKDPKKRRIKEELDAARDFLAILRREFPKAEIVYKVGNHEERYWRYMRVKAPELCDIQAFSFAELMQFEKFNVQLVDGRTKSNIASLSAFHGHEFGGSVFSPVNVARGLYLRTKASSICGHSHQTSEHTERDVNGKIVTCWSVGCLSELSPEYAPYNKWNLGFAFIEVNGDQFKVNNFRISNGRIL